MRKILLLVLFFLGIGQKGFSQIDTAFWFAAPDISSSFNYDRPIVFRVTSYQFPCTVTVSQPANATFVNQTITLAPYTTQTIDLTSQLAAIECAPGNVILNKGLKITSNNNIAVYYEVNVNGPNPELFALKGRNALGTQFFITSQNFLNNSNAYTVPPISSFNIVASEDNTLVTINPSKAIVGHAANVPYTITLNRGQAYAAIAVSQLASQHLDGSTVSSTKPIAITLADDLLEGGTTYGGGCQDLAGDQTIPVSVLGMEYIAIRSNLNFPYDKLNVIATQNGTTIKQDGVLVTTLNIGQEINLSVNNPSTYIQTSAPAYVYQAAGSGCEMGSSILPKIECTGSGSVSVARSSSEPLSITLLVKNGGQGNFLINNASGVITASQFAVVPGTGGQWYFAKILLSLTAYPNGSVIKVDNTSHLFQMGFLQGGTLGLSFGYFSDYNTVKAEASAANLQPCEGTTISLSAAYLPSAIYTWTGPAGFSFNGQNPPAIMNITAANSGDYILNATVPNCGTFKDTVTINVLPKAFKNITQQICQGQNYNGHTATGSYTDIFTAANGCDSIVSLSLTVKPKSFTTNNQIICEGQNYEGHNTSGTYVSTLVAANGCDSIYTLNLTVKPRSFTTNNQTICEGQSYQGHTTSGTYVSTLVAANGCDSIYTLNLTVKPRSFTTNNQTICEGQSYQGHTTSGTYVSTLVAANGCDSIYTLNLTVKPRSFTTNNQTICEGQTYQGHTASGTYVSTLVAANGCDSIYTLNLTVKPRSFTTNNQIICDGQTYQGHTTSGTYITTLVAANGCDSIYTLNLTVKPKSYTTNNQTICEGQSYQGHTTTGTYVSTFVAANGCDSIYTLNLLVKPKSFSTVNITICDGQSYAGHTTAGTYTDTYAAANGCDSIRTLNLTVKPKSFTTNNQTICEGQTYQGHTTSGTYVSTLVAANGCDSIYTLNLTVNPRSFTTNNQSICEGQSYQGHTTSGTYVTTLTAANGCDSIYTLNLVVKPKSYTTNNQSICEGQTYQGHSTSGTYTTTFTAANGCDSIYTLNLIVKPKSTSTIYASVCQGQSYAGHTTTGTYTDIYTAANGCDSIRTLILTIKPKSFSTVTQTICEGQIYQGHSTAGTYVSTLVAANGCDSIYTLILTVNPKSSSIINKTICEGQSFEGYSTTGTYNNIFTAANGCDSTRTLNLTVSPLPIPYLGKDTSICRLAPFKVSPGTFDSYLWQDGSQLSYYNISAPGVYSVTVTNSCGTGSDAITVTEKSCDFYFPNVFSPNGDTKNDYFNILNPSGITYYSLTIFNRWGEKVFETNNINYGWNGNYMNKPCPQGAYVWYSKMKKGGKDLTVSGSVILLR